MRADLAARRLAQRVLQAFGQRFDGRLGDVVGGVAGGHGDALLAPGVDDRRRAALVDHRLGEGLDAVDHAAEIDGEHAVPALRVLMGLGAAGDAGVVHEEIDAAEPARRPGP